MEKFKYAPGMPGYGSKGTDGSAGLEGYSIYATDYDATGSPLFITKLKERITSQQSLFSDEPPPYIYLIDGVTGTDSGRRYQTGDIFVDVNARVYRIELTEDPPYTFADITLGGGASLFDSHGSPISIGGKTYQRYANFISTEAQGKLVDTFVSLTATDYPTQRGPLHNYNILGNEFGHLYYNDIKLGTNQYNAFNLWTAAENQLGVEEELRAISLVRNSINNNWRLGNLTTGETIITTPEGGINPPTLSLDFNKVGIGRDALRGLPGAALDVFGDVSISNRLHMTVTTGTAPFMVNSQTLVNNLNVERLNGQVASYYATQGQTMNIGSTSIAINRSATTLTTLNNVTSEWATNLAGGAATRMPYQTNSGVTAFTLPSATAGAVMTLVGGTTPTWSAPATGGTVTSVGTDGTALTGGPITISGTITHSTASGYKHLPSGGGAGNVLQWASDGTGSWWAPSYISAAVTSVATATGITGGTITSTGTISHISGDPWNHIPTGGSASQILQYQSSGLAAWYSPPWTTNTGTVTSVGTSGAITGGAITTSGTISHSTADGYVHVPSGGSSGNILGWSSTGTAYWRTFTGISGSGVATITVGTSDPGGAEGDLWIDTN